MAAAALPVLAGGATAVGTGAAAAGAATAATAAAAAAPAAAAGWSLGQLALTAGSLISAGGALYSGYQQSQQAEAYAKAQEQQAETERMLGAIEDQRVRERMRAELGRMQAGLAARGVTLGSPSSLALADRAARETSFASQEARSRSGARVGTLTASARQSRALGGAALLKGGIGAAGSLLTAAPELWPELSARRVLA
ncbi:hypothetical protein [Albimonas pacifica]|nr:hypothetical protein [Albimonas pacifica]